MNIFSSFHSFRPRFTNRNAYVRYTVIFNDTYTLSVDVFNYVIEGIDAF